MAPAGAAGAAPHRDRQAHHHRPPDTPLTPPRGIEDASPKAKQGAELAGADAPLLDEAQPSLLRHPAIPAVVRWGLPFLLVANDALLLYSNFGPGATIHVRVFDGEGKSTEPASLYTLKLAHSVKDLWDAGAFGMSVLIAVFSGAWPHVKSLLSLLCWCLDSRRLKPATRRVLLSMAYLLQKLSHVETFMLVISMNGGSLKMHLPEHDDWGFNTVINPRPGFYCFLTGLCVSMLLSRVALHYDQRATEAWADQHQQQEQQQEKGASSASAADASSPLAGQPQQQEQHNDDDDEEDKAAASCESGGGPGPLVVTDNGHTVTQQLSLPSKRSSNSSSSSSSSRSCARRLRHLVDTVGVPSGSVAQDLGVAYFLLALLAFLAVGLCVPCFRFIYKGMGGWVLAHITEDWPDASPPVVSATVLSLGVNMAQATDNPTGLGIRYIQAAYLFFVVVAPLGCLCCLLLLVLLPPAWLAAPADGGGGPGAAGGGGSKKGTRRGALLTAAEVLYAWSAPDVLFVSMFTATLELDNFVAFAIGDRCDSVNAFLRAVFDKALGGDDVCFDMQTAMSPGIWLFGVASLAFFATGGLVLRNAHRLMDAAADDHEQDTDEAAAPDARASSPSADTDSFARRKGARSCCRGWDLGWGPSRGTAVRGGAGGNGGVAEPLLQGDESKWEESENGEAA